MCGKIGFNFSHTFFVDYQGVQGECLFLRGKLIFDFPTHFLLIVKGFRAFVEMWEKNI